MLINGVFPCLGEAFLLKRVEVPAESASWTQHITHLLWHWAKETLCIPQLIKTISKQQKAISPQWQSNNGVTAQPRDTKAYSVQYWSSALRMLMTVFAVESKVNLFYSYVCVFLERGIWDTSVWKEMKGIVFLSRWRCADCWWSVW